MSKTVVLVGALDTKGAEFAHVKRLIENRGLETLVIDFGVMGPPVFEPDISRDEVMAAAGGDPVRLATGRHKDEAMRSMGAGLAVVVRRLYGEGRLGGILGMGGSSGTSIATAAMRALPVGVPKLMVSTIVGGDVSAFAGTRDITFMPSIVDIAGLNRISRRIFANAAGAIAGMVLADAPAEADPRPLVVASMFGNTTPAVDRAREALEAAGYEAVIFHAVGSGGRAMEALIADGFVTAALDITTTELADEVCGGVMSAGPERGLAASRAGIPAVLVPGCVDMANFGAPETIPEKYARRTFYRWNPDTTLMRTTADENRRIGEMLAAAANAATGPAAILLPLRGLSMLDAEGREFWDPAADRACFDAIRATVRADEPVIEVDAHINDPAFADRAVEELLRMLRR
ncbi:MAG TPA: Tm-1-like ATP-binding domain-containing protein [Candidatus Limnocylindria bacterium]